MPSEREARAARDYFDEWAGDYQRAFEGRGGETSPLQRIVNRLFRAKTFRLRAQHLAHVLDSLELAGKTVVDVGCGSGELALEAASRGARVTGLDISQEMIAVATRQAREAGLTDATAFRVFDCVHGELPQADVVLCIAVFEYYQDCQPLVRELCRCAREVLVVCDARFIWWRAALRKLLARLKGFSVFYHAPGKVKALAQASGMTCVAETPIHSFRTFVFRRL